MNFVMGLAYHSVSVAQWLSIRAQNPKFWGSIPPSWGLRIFSSSHACDKTWKHLSPFLYQAQNLPSSLFYLLINLFHSLSAFVLAPIYLSPLVKLLFSLQNAKKKRNRKKQAKTNDPETSDVAVIKENNEKVSQLNQNSLEGIVHVMEIKEIFRLCKGNKKPSKIILHLKKLFWNNTSIVSEGEVT